MTVKRNVESSATASTELKRAAVRGSFWVAVGFVGTIVIRLASSVILTRFIHPETYGLMDLVMTVIIAVHLFSDIGLGPCMVQSPRGEEERFVNTVWTMQIVRNVLLFFITILVALPVAALYERSILRWLIPAVGLCNLVESFYSPGMLLLNRSLKRGPIVAIELVAAFLTMVGTVGAVFAWDPDGVRQVVDGKISSLPLNESLVWTIVIGTIMSRLVCLALTYLITPEKRPRFDWERETIKEVFTFGRWIFLSTILLFFAAQTDRLLAPNLAGFEASGLYGRAAALAAIANGLIETLSNSIIFPMVGRVREQSGNLSASVSRIGLMAKVLGGVLLTGLLVAGPSAVNLLYPAAYSDVGWILQALAVIGWFQCNSSIAGAILLGIGHPKQMMYGNLAKFLGLALAAFPVTHFVRASGWEPLMGLLIALAVGEACRYAIYVVVGMKLRVWRLGQDGLVLAAVALTSWIAMKLGQRGVLALLGVPPQQRSEWLLAAVVYGGAVCALWGAIAAVLWRMGIVSFKLRPSPPPTSATT